MTDQVTVRLLDRYSLVVAWGLLKAVLSRLPCNGVSCCFLPALNMKMQLRVILTGKSVGSKLGDVDGFGVGVDMGGSV